MTRDLTPEEMERYLEHYQERAEQAIALDEEDDGE